MRPQHAENDWVYNAFPQARPAATFVYNKLKHSGKIEWFRERWNIPALGFNDEKNFQKWYSQFVVKATDNFQKSKNFKEKDAKSHLQKPLVKFENDIVFIMRNLKIPQRYELFVRSSLTCKDMPADFPLDRDKPKFEFRTDQITGRKRLLIEVFSDTTVSDFNTRTFKNELEGLQRKLDDFGSIKQIGSKKIGLWEQVSRWRDKGKTYRIIRELAKKEFNHDFGNDQAVGTALTRYKRKMANTRKIEK